MKITPAISAENIPQQLIMEAMLKMLLPHGYDALLAARNEAMLQCKAVTFEGYTAVKILGEDVKIQITFYGNK